MKCTHCFAVLLGLIVLLLSSREALATYGGLTIEELVASSDAVVVGRRKGPERIVGRKPLRYGVTLVVKEVWKGNAIPKEILVEYELSEGTPQIGPFGTRRDFVAFLTRLEPKGTGILPSFAMRLGADAALLIPGPKDLCDAVNLVEAPIGTRDGGARFLDLRWLRANVARLVRAEQKSSVVPAVPMPETSGKAGQHRP